MEKEFNITVEIGKSDFKTSEEVNDETNNLRTEDSISKAALFCYLLS